MICIAAGFSGFIGVVAGVIAGVATHNVWIGVATMCTVSFGLIGVCIAKQSRRN